MSVYDVKNNPFLSKEINYIKEAIEQGMTVLGICLGAQLIAKALGGEVFPAEKPEIGWYPIELTDSGKEDPLFQHFEKRSLEVAFFETLLVKINTFETVHK